LHDGIHRGIEEGTVDDKQTSFEITCAHEVEKEVHREEDLVHHHLKEIEERCDGEDDVRKCKEDVAIGVVGAVEETITKYTKHCTDTDSLSFWAFHLAVDNFVKVHEAEIEEALHKNIHEAMNATGSGGSGGTVGSMRP